MKLYYLTNNSLDNKIIKKLFDIYKKNKCIKKSYPKYLDEINKNKILKYQYHKFKNRIEKIFFPNELNIQNKKVIQKGGLDSNFMYLGLSSSSLLIFLMVGAFLIYMYSAKNKKKCLPEYPLVNQNEIIDPINIISKISPRLGNQQTIDDLINLSQSFDSYRGYLMNIVELGLSAGAMIGTGGLGGDIIVKVLFSIFDIIDFLNFIIETIYQINDPYLLVIFSDILNIDFRDGPHGVKCWVEYIMYVYGDNMQAINSLCTFYDKIRDKIANYIGKIIGSFIPNSPRFIAGIIAQQIIKIGQSKLFRFVEKKYENINSSFKLYLQNPEHLTVLIQNILENMKIYTINFPEKFPFIIESIIKSSSNISARFNPNVFTRAAVNISSNLVGRIAGKSLSTVSRITGIKNIEQLGVPIEGIDEFYDNLIDNSDIFANGLHKFMSFIFSLLYILKYCSR